jgi:AraC family transcriptional regulator of adaptative response / DNA-3-methyladenine glycosylase II
LKARPKLRAAESAIESDATLEVLEASVADVRSNPSGYKNVDAVASRMGLNSADAAKALHRHYHATPGELLLRARLEASKSLLLESKSAIADIAGAVGFESALSFKSCFLRLNGLTPKAFRNIQSSSTFRIQLPAGYSLPYLRRALGRDYCSVTERLSGSVYTAAVRLGQRAHVLSLELSPSRVIASIAPKPRRMRGVHAMVVGLLGLDQETDAFCKRANHLGVQRLVSKCPQLRVHQTHSIFDGLLWAIIGQQINLPFAFQLRRRLMELKGTSMSGELHAPPTPEAVAELEPSDLLPLQFSRQKADYVVSTARLIASGGLQLDSLRTMSATKTERTLLAVRGLGVWSVNYLMMRSLGFADCLPIGDTGVTSGLQALYQLDQRPNADETRRMTAPFSPHRSLATAHLWQFTKPLPA